MRDNKKQAGYPAQAINLYAMKKVKVSLKLFRLNPERKVELARTIVKNMTGNSDFATPVPELTVITSAADALELAIHEAHDRSKTKIAVLRAREVDLDNVLTQLSLYVESISNNDATKILSAGMGVKASPNPVKAPEKPDTPEVQRTEKEGEVLLKWKRVPGAMVYVVEQSHDKVIRPQAEGSVSEAFISYTQVDIVTTSRLTIEGLEGGRRYAFRVYCVGSGGKSAPSAPAIVKLW